MRLLILGQNNDDKGCQLEQLTTKILEHQGFENLTTNIQVVGASELDVTGVKIERAGIKSIEQPILCECKAHAKPIVMTDWLKFIGKLYIVDSTKNLAIMKLGGNICGVMLKDNVELLD